MEHFFDPRAVALVGASPRKIGLHLLNNLVGRYKGRIYPVNRNHAKIGDLTCYPTVEAIPDAVDLAIVLVPAPLTPEVLESCAAKGVPAVMIQSAGFAETGAQGEALQETCLQIARQASMRIWGPNCMGLVDVPGQKYFTFMHSLISELDLIPGRVSLVVQSGMLSAGFLADLTTRYAMGVAKVCSIGNKADVDESDMLDHLLADRQTRAVALYLESLKRGRVFLELAAGATKPIVVLKGGRSRSGARAATSHTASLAGDARLVEGLLAEAGVVLAHDFHQMMDLAATLAATPQMPPGGRLAILTFSGGAGIISCDLLEQHGLSVARLSPAAEAALKEIFPDWMPVGNPVDLYPAMNRVGRMQAIKGAAAAALADPGVDGILLHHFAGLDDQDFELADLKAMADQRGKTLAVWVVGLWQEMHAFRRRCGELGVPVYGRIEQMAQCLAAAAAHGQHPPGPKAEVRAEKQAPAPGGRRAAWDGREVWDERQSKRLLADWGIEVVAERPVESLPQALKVAEELGYPLVLKGLPPDQSHKTELGLVHLGLANAEQLSRALGELQEALDGRGQIVAQAMVPGDYELIAGFLRDPQLGPCLMLGRGGLLAELEPDVAFAAAPLEAAAAEALVGRLRCQRLLNGFRGRPPLDRGHMARLLARLSQLGLAHGEIKQIDLNPLVIIGGRALAVDANVFWGPPA